jgi:hypothetical protein
MRWLGVDDQFRAGRRLFSARVSRVRGTYTVSARCFVRLIGQYTSIDRDPTLYLSSVAATSGSFNGSLLFGYKVNWQSVLFIGYGDDRELSDQDRLEKAARQFFVKVSYAFQR